MAKRAPTTRCPTTAIVEQAAQTLSWLEMEPYTGRTHQLRVHAAHIGCPIIGDPKYFEADTNWDFPGGIQNRLHLHARRIVIPHPDKGVIDVTAPMPPHMRQSWNLIGFDDASARGTRLSGAGHRYARPPRRGRHGRRRHHGRADLFLGAELRRRQDLLCRLRPGFPVDRAVGHWRAVLVSSGAAGAALCFSAATERLSPAFWQARFLVSSSCFSMSGSNRRPSRATPCWSTPCRSGCWSAGISC